VFAAAGVGAALVELLDELDAARATAVDRATPAGPAHEFVQVDLGSDAAAYLDGVNVPVDAGMQAALLTDQTDYGPGPTDDPNRRTRRLAHRERRPAMRMDRAAGRAPARPGAAPDPAASPARPESRARMRTRGSGPSARTPAGRPWTAG